MIETKAVAPLGTRLRQVIELLDLRERDVHLRLARRAQRRDHRRQPMDGLRPEHQVHERRALEDALAFLARDAAADADDETWLAACFSSRHWPRCENTFSCAFSRTEQVFRRTTSASSGWLVSSRPADSRSTSAMRAESYSFIWQPKVEM